MPKHHYCLRWNHHQPNFISTFCSLLTEECFVDVTLAAEEKHIQAHKVILSSCSTYFKELFKVNPCQHPIVILKDVKYDDLKSIIDFIYRGEVSVSHEQLQSVLKTAVQLNIKGLADMPVTVSEEKTPPQKVSYGTIAGKKRKLKRSTRSLPSPLKSPKKELEIVECDELAEYVVVRDEHSHDSCPYASEEFSNECSIDSRNESSVIPPTLNEENSIGISVITGLKKRNKFLVRQDDIIVKNEMSDVGSNLEICENKHPLIKQYSDPTPHELSNNSEIKKERSSIPVPHLQKQNSDSTINFSREDQQSSILVSDPLDSSYLLKNSAIKSNHCPTLRPGPALGCNFCWNTIDKQGRILRRKTKYHCPECRTNLCIVPCFQEYHSQKDNADNENDPAIKEIVDESSELPQFSSRQKSSVMHLTT